jgi:hypothetical protein
MATTDPNTAKARRFSIRLLRPLWIGGTVALLVAAAWVSYSRWVYPYGWSHSCDKQLKGALEEYANDHGGVFPAGESTPEASLSILYPTYANEWVLQGKTVPLEEVKAILENGGRLGPDSCGWHYVEGLRMDDNPRLALFWDKVGLGHNGERLEKAGHIVSFVGAGRNEYIEGAMWEDFLLEQEKLLNERKGRQ